MREERRNGGSRARDIIHCLAKSQILIITSKVKGILTIQRSDKRKKNEIKIA